MRKATNCPAFPPAQTQLDVYVAHDARKAAWAEELRNNPDKEFVARRLVALVETMHGKPNQTRNTLAVLDGLLGDSRVQALLEGEQPVFAAAAVRQAAGLLNLGEVYAPCAFYLADGPPTEAAKRNFAERPARAAHFVAQFDLVAAKSVGPLLRQFHVDAACARPVAAQLLDISERIAAMRAERPQRQGLPVERIISILRQQATGGIFAPALVDVAAEQLVADGADQSLVSASKQSEADG